MGAFSLIVVINLLNRGMSHLVNSRHPVMEVLLSCQENDASEDEEK